MSDFKNISDFKKNKLSKYPYQDPTYLSFVLGFNFNDKYNSPLLSGTAGEYLKELAQGTVPAEPVSDGEEEEPKAHSVASHYAERLEALNNFISALKQINTELPWYWQSLGGLERLLQYNPKNSYWGGDDAVLTIGTLESINLAISGLMQLYRKAVFDEHQWKYILPYNLRKFSMIVYVTEVRTIKNMSAPKINGADVNNFPENFKPSIQVTNSNSEISGATARPYFMFELGYCEFDITSGSNPFADLKKTPEGPAENEIKIHYDILKQIEFRALNGIVTTDFGTDKLSPAPDSETESPSNLRDWALGQANQKLTDIKGGIINDMQNYSRQKMQELQTQARNQTTNKIPNFENVFQNFVQGVDNTLSNNPSQIDSIVKDNVHGIQPGDTVGQALTRGAINSLGNVYG